MISIIMGSDSDLKVMQGASDIFDEFNVNYHIDIVSAHRTPERMFEFSKQAKSKGIKVIIAGAGGAAHLPGMVASMTVLPVIGVPINATDLNGIDALMSIVQMPAGVPVATMAVNNAKNAALFALKILAVSDVAIEEKLNEYTKKLEQTVLSKAKKLKEEKNT